MGKKSISKENLEGIVAGHMEELEGVVVGTSDNLESEFQDVKKMIADLRLELKKINDRLTELENEAK